MDEDRLAKEMEDLELEHRDVKKRTEDLLKQLNCHPRLVKAWIALDSLSLVYDSMIHTQQDGEDAIIALRELNAYEDALREAACCYLFKFLSTPEAQTEPRDPATRSGPS